MMDRLTIVTVDGDICFDVPDDPEGAYNITDLAEWDHFDVLNSVAERLKAYEDTGLSPEEIKDHEEMFAAYRNICGGLPPEEVERLIELGRSVVRCGQCEYNNTKDCTFDPEKLNLNDDFCSYGENRKDGLI